LTATIADSSDLAQFKQGIEFLRKGHAAKALECFRRAAGLKQQNPVYRSFLGVSLVRAESKWAEAVDLCKTALQMKRDEAQLYVNLAEVYVSAGRRDLAVEVLDRGLRHCGADARIKRMHGRVRKRRSPVLPFLERGHLLNRGLGKLRHQVLKRLLKSEN